MFLYFDEGTPIGILGIPSFDIESTTIQSSLDSISRVELIPRIYIDEFEVTCSTNIKSYGDLSFKIKSC
tara:strand:+ start:7732 stop:7938 length:207 start_codon:yes stop_codon:yes gene_type:complete